MVFIFGRGELGDPWRGGLILMEFDGETFSLPCWLSSFFGTFGFSFVMGYQVGRLGAGRAYLVGGCIGEGSVFDVLR